jgi:hypothetical protein
VLLVVPTEPVVVPGDRLAISSMQAAETGPLASVNNAAPAKRIEGRFMQSFLLVMTPGGNSAAVWAFRPNV